MKIAKPKFCPYSIELTLDGRSSVEAVADDGSLPQMKFEMVPLVEIQRLEPGRTVDIAAVVLERQEPTDMPMKRGGSRQLRRLVLGDMSGCQSQPPPLLPSLHLFFSFVVVSCVK